MAKKTTKERILKEAEKQFIKEGIAATQMKDIADAVEINRRTLYRYFPTKDELAFEIEMIVMGQIGEYFTVELDEPENLSGFEKVEKYFELFNPEEIREQMKFTAEFDRYFQADYPSAQLEQSFISALDPRNDDLYRFVKEGREDGTIRNDLTTDEIYHFISQNFFALFQRLILRERHLKSEYCEHIDFQKLFKEVTLSGIRKK